MKPICTKKKKDFKLSGYVTWCTKRKWIYFQQIHLTNLKPAVYWKILIFDTILAFVSNTNLLYFKKNTDKK